MKTRQEYEHEMLMLRDAIRDDPTNAAQYQKDLNSRISKWVEKLDITIFQANNEQAPLPATWLKYPVKPMLPKSVTGYDQTGDYIFFIDGHPLPIENKLGGIIFERKNPFDLHGTLYGDRDRFNDEIDRFKSFTWASKFVILVECWEDDFYNMVVPRRACKFCQFFKPDQEDKKKWGLCLVNSEFEMVEPLAECYHFIDHESDEERIANILNSKKATIDDLEVEPGVQIRWCGSRQRMAEIINGMIRQWCRQNWERILGLDIKQNVTESNASIYVEGMV